jgi:phosphate transport system substrate-binding protein
MFSAENPEADITVQGGGSGTGLSQVSTGAADIGMSDITVEDLADLKKTDLVDNKVAIVGIAVVAHPAVGVRNLTKQQLADIFTGRITNWKAVGGKQQKITVVNRPKGSGTRITFTKLTLNGKEAVETITQDSSGTVRKIIASTPGAVGYLAFSYVNNTVQSLNIDNVAPTEANVLNRSYPIWSYEHLYTKGRPTGLKKSFIDYVQGKAVQEELVPKLEYIPLSTDESKK